MGVLHRVYNETDKQVHHRKCGHQNERHKEGPCIGVNFHYGTDDSHRPAFKRHDLKQRIGAAPQGSEPFREHVAEQFCRHDRADIEDDRHQ